MLPRIILLIVFASSLLAAEPEKLVSLRVSYQSAITKATAPIQKTYLAELEKLKSEFTRSGNLEAALAVDTELKTVASAQSAGPTDGLAPVSTTTGQPAASTKAVKLREDLSGSRWEVTGQEKPFTMTLNADGSCSFEPPTIWGNGFKWSIDDSGALLTQDRAGTKPRESKLTGGNRYFEMYWGSRLNAKRLKDK